MFSHFHLDILWCQNFPNSRRSLPKFLCFFSPQALAKKHEGEYMQCSAKAAKNVKEVFESIAVQIRNQKEIEED
jgi:hypothetical protein